MLAAALFLSRYNPPDPQLQWVVIVAQRCAKTIVNACLNIAAAAARLLHFGTGVVNIGKVVKRCIEVKTFFHMKAKARVQRYAKPKSVCIV